MDFSVKKTFDVTVNVDGTNVTMTAESGNALSTTTGQELEQTFVLSAKYFSAASAAYTGEKFSLRREGNLLSFSQKVKEALEATCKKSLEDDGYRVTSCNPTSLNGDVALEIVYVKD